MFEVLIPSIILFFFGFFTLLGIRSSYGFIHLGNAIVAGVIYVVLKKIGPTFFRSNAKFFYWCFIFLLAITYIIGLEVKGSRRWIDFKFFHFQASEFFKVFYIMYLSRLFSKKTYRSDDTFIFIKSIFYFIIPTLIIFLQPDLGNAMVYVFIYLVMLIFSDIARKHIVTLMGMSIGLLPIGWLFLKEYQKNRILSYFSPHMETQRNAYNMIQAVITIGSGGWLGRGLGFGTQSRLYFLPENSTDFAFSSLVEQFGFLGGGMTIILFMVLIGMLVRRASQLISREDMDSRARFLYCIGFTAFLVFQIFINIGMNLGILPIAGIALPFISYGGSMLVTLFIGFAFLQ